MFIAHVEEEGLCVSVKRRAISICTFGRRLFVITHGEEKGLFGYFPFRRRRKGYLFMAHMEEGLLLVFKEGLFV